MTRWTVYFATAVLAGAAEGVLLAPRPVEAVAREILGLQEDLKQLTQAQKESETTLVQNAAVNKTLIEQLMDTAHKMRDDMTNLEKRVEEMRAASGGRMDAMNTQTEGVSDGIQAKAWGKSTNNLSISKMHCEESMQSWPSALLHPAPLFR